MKIRELKNRLGREIVFLDGAMGTSLQRKGLLRTGGCPERLNLTHGDEVEAVHREYVRAGAEILYTNTFGANPCKLPADLDLREVLGSAVTHARNAAEGKAFVALDMGPTGKLLGAYGDADFEDAYGWFSRVVELAEEFSPDLYVIETMSDLYEAKAALLAVKEHSSRPVLVTMSYDGSGRTFMGCDIRSMGTLFEAMGADAVGINCSLAPGEMLGPVRMLRSATSLPIVAKANAGLPDAEMNYSVDAQAFAKDMLALVRAGASVVGGCCGTDAEYVSAMKRALAGIQPNTALPPARLRLCSPTQYFELTAPAAVGECINPSGKPALCRALAEEDFDTLADLAMEQRDAGAEILDVNVGAEGVDEFRALPQAVRAVQDAVRLPLSVDTLDSRALEQALRVCNGKPLVNSVTGSADVLARVLPLVKKYGAAVVGMTLDENGIPSTAEGRLEIARCILEAARKYGIPDCDVLIDPVCMSVCTAREQISVTLDALRLISRELGTATVLGISNISYGMPERSRLNRAFLPMALSAGLMLPILNPLSPGMLETVETCRAMLGDDEAFADYISRCAEREHGKL